MKKINFTFKDNDNIIYDLCLPYEVEDEYVVFSIENEKFKVLLKDEFHFLKYATDNIFEIKILDKKACGYYTLIKENMTFSVDIFDFEYTHQDKKYIIKYNIESDESSSKTIIFSFD